MDWSHRLKGYLDGQQLQRVGVVQALQELDFHHLAKTVWEALTMAQLVLLPRRPLWFKKIAQGQENQVVIPSSTIEACWLDVGTQ